MRSTYPFDRSALFLRDLNDLRARWEAALFVVSEVTTEKLCENLWVLTEHLRELGVGSRKLLDDRAGELRVLHHDFTQMLNLGVVHERSKVRCSACTSRTRTSRAQSSEPSTCACATSTLLLLLLLGKLE